MRPLRCQPHPLYLPRPGQPSIPQSKVAGWTLGARGLEHEYKGPPWPPPAPEIPVTDTEVTAWRARHQATCSDKVARLLCALERDYAIRREIGS